MDTLFHAILNHLFMDCILNGFRVWHLMKWQITFLNLHVYRQRLVYRDYQAFHILDMSMLSTT